MTIEAHRTTYYVDEHGAIVYAEDESERYRLADAIDWFTRVMQSSTAIPNTILVTGYRIDGVLLVGGLIA